MRILKEDFNKFDELEEKVKSSIRELADIKEIETMSFGEEDKEPIYIGSERRFIGMTIISKTFINQKN